MSNVCTKRGPPAIMDAVLLRPKTLRWRVTLAVSAFIAATMFVGSIGVWGVVRINADSKVAARGYRQLREVYEVGMYVERAKQQLGAAASERGDVSAKDELSTALARLNVYTVDADAWLLESRPVELQLRADLVAAVRNPSVVAIEQSIAQLAALASQVRVAVDARQLSAARERRLSLVLISGACGGIVLMSLAVGGWLYRSTVRPVERFAAAVRRFAARDLDGRVDATGPREFAMLARDLNHMADELQSMYLNLEQQVDQKSRELVRSERLASVGYLAAGVAHEINNPLSIIAAYAERSLQRMRTDGQTPIDADVDRSLRIICDEAFRCKEITDRLLSLVHGSANDVRRPASIAGLAQDVADTVIGLPPYSHARLTITCAESDRALRCLVNDAEIKQVLLNLFINAFESIEPAERETQDEGRVDVRIERVTLSDDQCSIRTIVSDNGCGMSRDTMDRAFEPFYSAKTGRRAGTGLGLAICHAIVESHGGTLSAASDGVGRGSTFTVTLPCTVNRASRAASARGDKFANA